MGDFTDSREFAEYAAACVEVLRRRRRPMNTRELHKALGRAARREWTMMALRFAADYVIHIPKLPCDLFAYEPDVRVAVKDIRPTFVENTGRKKGAVKV